MIKLRDILEILPKYDRNNAYGKIGEVKSTTIFNFGNRELHFKELNEDLINNSMVKKIQDISNSFGKFSNSYLIVYCEESE